MITPAPTSAPTIITADELTVEAPLWLLCGC